MLSRSQVHRELFMRVVTDFVGLTTPSSKKSRVLENMAAGSVSLTKEEFDDINQLVEGLGVHGFRYTRGHEGILMR